MRVSYSVAQPLVIGFFYQKDDGHLLVDLPTFTDVVFLSPETEVCPSLYRNLERRDQVFNDHVKAYKLFATQETAVQTQTDLAINQEHLNV